MTKPKPKPNVVPEEAGLFARSYVFDHKGAEVMEPRAVVEEMIAAGHGAEFPSKVRSKRLRTWVLQVFRRLKKRGWLEGPGADGWSPTAALKSCTDSRRLGKPVPRQTVVKSRPRPRPQPQSQSQPTTPEQPTPEFWEFFVGDWVFKHRDREFGVAEVAVAVVQAGFGTGDVGHRLDGARVLVESALARLEEAGLLVFRNQAELWKPTQLLRDWPTSS